MNPSPSGEAAAATAVPEMEMVTLRIAEIVPYWRNPRRISDEAVNAVAESIKLYGYQQPIVVDTSKCIVMGHTRYSALRRMGVVEIPVLVARGLSDKQIKELRTIDNRTSEYTRWDFEKLVDELSGLDAQLMTAFFPELVGPSKDEEEAGDATVDQMVVDMFEKVDDPKAEFVCPGCFHSWEMPISREEVFSGTLRVRKDQS